MLPERAELPALLAHQVNLKGYKPALGADSYPVAAGTGWVEHRVWPRVGNVERLCPKETFEFVFNKRFESLMALHPGQSCVASAFETGKQCLAESLGSKERALPEAFFHPIAVDKVYVLHPELGTAAENTSKHLWARQGEH